MKGMFLLGQLIGVIIVGLTMALMFSYPVMWLWNYGLASSVQGINRIDLFQAASIFFLIRLLWPSDKFNLNFNK